MVHIAIPAAGIGSRFSNSIPKQFLFLYDIIAKFLKIEAIEGIVCALPTKYIKTITSKENKLVSFIEGGNNRQESVFNCLEELSKYNPKFVLIHDAARPYVSIELIKRVISSLPQHRAIVPVINPVDSVRINSSVSDRNIVNLVQTPQGFDFNLIYKLHKKHRNKNMSDDASLCDLDNVEVTLIKGEMANKKITYKEDLEQSKIYKTGLGFDSHGFSSDPSKKLRLCGITIENHKGLHGVSDADVVIHSVVDAILGAIGQGSIGEHFPESSSKDVNSLIFLSYIQDLLIKECYTISNIDITIICDTVRITDYKNEMQHNIAKALGIETLQVNVKGKTTEGTSINGITALTNVLISKYVY